MIIELDTDKGKGSEIFGNILIESEDTCIYSISACIFSTNINNLLSIKMQEEEEEEDDCVRMLDMYNYNYKKYVLNMEYLGSLPSAASSQTSIRPPQSVSQYKVGR